jgi:hypothetical protein
MRSEVGIRASRALLHDVCRILGVVFALVTGCCVGGCATDGTTALMRPTHGATVAFESIDGPPRPVFNKLVASLSAEAESRQVAVVSREADPAYRIRGYLAAHVEHGRTQFVFVWDVYDAAKQRALRISGEETGKLGKRKPADAWAAADDAVVGRIARASMDQLVAFLAAPGGVAPSEPVNTGPAIAAAPADAASAPRRPEHRAERAASKPAVALALSR